MSSEAQPTVNDTTEATDRAFLEDARRVAHLGVLYAASMMEPQMSSNHLAWITRTAKRSLLLNCLGGSPHLPLRPEAPYFSPDTKLLRRIALEQIDVLGYRDYWEVAADPEDSSDPDVLSARACDDDIAAVRRVLARLDGTGSHGDEHSAKTEEQSKGGTLHLIRGGQ